MEEEGKVDSGNRPPTYSNPIRLSMYGADIGLSDNNWKLELNPHQNTHIHNAVKYSKSSEIQHNNILTF